MAIDAEVVVVGGGLAGLNAACLLHRAGVDVRVFEARPRLGGRVLTVSDRDQPEADGFDLGPSWFWPGMQPDIAELVTELGLSSFEQYSDGDVVSERSARGPVQRYPAYRQEPQSMRLVGGSAALIRALACLLPGDRIHTSVNLRALRLRENAVFLTLRRADGSELIITARQVIAAVPPRILAGTINFAPALDPATLKLWQRTPTWMAPHAKLFAVYERPFWRAHGLSGGAHSLVGPLAEIHDVTTASGRAALFGFVGLGPGQRAGVGEAALIKASVAQFVRLFGPEAATPRTTFYKDWATDPLTAIDNDSEPSGHPGGADKWVDGVWRERLVLAGSETSPENAGYLAGAVVASRLAASAVATRCTL